MFVFIYEYLIKDKDRNKNRNRNRNRKNKKRRCYINITPGGVGTLIGQENMHHRVQWKLPTTHHKAWVKSSIEH